MELDIFPCVVFGYNRPDKLQLVLSALKSQGIDRLIVFIDGPKDYLSIEQVEQCRTIAKKIDWVDVEFCFNEQNYGLSGFWKNINNVMAKYSSAVFVEDDCLPMVGFYSFMRQAIMHYKEEKKVFSIGGYQCLNPKYFKNYPYSLMSCHRFTCWGWATWRDRWAEVQPYLNEYWKLFNGLKNIPDIADEDLTDFGKSKVDYLQTASWDIRVAILSLWLKKVHLLPKEGLIKNIGADGSGIHDGKSSLHLHNRNLSLKSPSKIVWLENVEPDSYYIKSLKHFVSIANNGNRGLRQVFHEFKRKLRKHHLIVKFWQKLNRIKMEFFVYSAKTNYTRLYDIQLLNNGCAMAKRVLLSYIVHPFCGSPANLQFSNFGIARSIVRVLNELGYIVDIVEWDDIKFQPTKKYDLFIGHGGCNFKHIARRLSKDTIKIYFSTGLYWQEHNRREKERFDNLRKRRKVRLPYDRWIKYSEEYANKSADGIICLGNQVAKESYSKFPLVINLNNAAYSNGQYSLETKDFSVARKNFLFFAGGGNIHKGLDLLLETFSRVKNANLYICQEIDTEFYKVYRHELEDYSNIHLVGHIPMRSLKFYELVDKCVYVILPSCSEGCTGSVVECMHHGLIPVVTKETAIETSNYGIVLNSPCIKEISEAVEKLSQCPSEWCKDMSQWTRKVAVTEFSEAAFLRNMRNAIQCVITQKSKQEIKK